MRLLLDTHVWLWSLLDPDKLDSAVAEALENVENQLFISPITVWETLILAEKGRIVLDTSPQMWVREAIRLSSVQEAHLSHAVAIQSRAINLPHQDPADRFIAATALEYGLTLITADEKLKTAEQLRNVIWPIP